MLLTPRIAPVPKTKKSRELKTDFMPLDLGRYVPRSEIEQLYGKDALAVLEAQTSTSKNDS